MKTRFIFFLTTFLLIMTVAHKAKSQIEIVNISEIAKIKSGTTYVLMKDPNSESVKDFIKVFKDSWTISKLEFIKYSDFEKYLAPEDSFLTIGGYLTNTTGGHVTNVEFTKLYKLEKGGHHVYWPKTHIYLELWTCKEKYFQRTKKKKKKFTDRDKIRVARIELFTDFETIKDPAYIYQSDYDGDGHIRNWGPGILKNYIQSLMVYLNNGEARSVFTGMNNPTEIKNLKKETLYVPDYVLIKFNKINGDESKKLEEKEIFENYKLKYKIIPISELNEKILNDTTAIYYLIYIKSVADKFINVINSLTGEIIYSRYSPVSYNIRSEDLEALEKKILSD